MGNKPGAVAEDAPAGDAADGAGAPVAGPGSASGSTPRSKKKNLKKKPKTPRQSKADAGRAPEKDDDDGLIPSPGPGPGLGPGPGPGPGPSQSPSPSGSRRTVVGKPWHRATSKARSTSAAQKKLNDILALKRGTVVPEDQEAAAGVSSRSAKPTLTPTPTPRNQIPEHDTLPESANYDGAGLFSRFLQTHAPAQDSEAVPVLTRRALNETECEGGSEPRIVRLLMQYLLLDGGTPGGGGAATTPRESAGAREFLAAMVTLRDLRSDEDVLAFAYDFMTYLSGSSTTLHVDACAQAVLGAPQEVAAEVEVSREDFVQQLKPRLQVSHQPNGDDTRAG